MQRDPREDASRFIDQLVPFAVQMLQQHGEFFPFGARMNLEGDIGAVSAYDGDENPPSQILIDALRSTFKEGAERGEIIASCTVFDIVTIPPGCSEKQDAIAFEIDHRDGFSATVIYPYRISAESQVDLGDSFAVLGEKAIFHQNR